MRHLNPVFGIEIDVDLNNLTHAMYRKILFLLARHKLILIRNQKLNEKSYIRFGKGLGKLWLVNRELKGNGESSFAVNDYSEVAKVSNKGGMLGDKEVRWHSDLAHHPTNPCPGRILYGVKLPFEASVTRWIDLEFGWRHLLGKVEKTKLKNIFAEYNAKYPTAWGPVKHRVLRKHPVRKTIWPNIDEIFFNRFIGLENEESENLKQVLLSKLISPEAEYCHVWRQGDVIVYDNKGTIHKREEILNKKERTLWRLTVDYNW